MTEMVSTEWWLALPAALLSMNRQVHSTTGKSPYEIVFKQLMPDRPRISTSQRSTAAAIEQLHDIQGLVITQPDTPLDSSIAPSIDPLLNDSGETCTQQKVTAGIQSDAVRVLNEEVIANTQRKVIAMEKRYNKVNKVEVFEEGDLVRLKIPVEDRCTTDNKRIFCRVIDVKYGNQYSLQCEYGILPGFYRTKNMDRLTSTIPHHIPPFKKGSHRELTLREAARLQSPAELMQVRCGCKGNCATVRCKCFKGKVECTLHCHGRDGGARCTNTGDSAAPSGTFKLKRNTRPAPPEPNQKRQRADTQGNTCTRTDPTSVDDTGNESSDLTDLDTEDEEVFEEEEVTWEEEPEEEAEVNEEDGSEEEMLGSNDMEQSVIVVASGRLSCC
jgi:hypothetical protein